MYILREAFLYKEKVAPTVKIPRNCHRINNYTVVLGPHNVAVAVGPKGLNKHFWNQGPAPVYMSMDSPHEFQPQSHNKSV